MTTPPDRPTFGVFLSTGETYHRPILRQLKRAALELDVGIVICGFPSAGSFNKVEDRYTLEDLGYRTRLDGTLAVFGAPPLLERMADLHRQGHPCVFVLRQSETVPHLIPDDEAAIEALVRRLHRHGHRRIVFLRGWDKNHSARRRLEGYRRGLEAAGLPLDPELILMGKFDEDASRQAIDATLARGIAFTAVIAGNDASAHGALQALEGRGIAVPGQVEVTGFDNLFSTALSDPPLSTFQLPIERMMYPAVECLLKMRQGRPVPLETRFFSRFIPRASTRFSDRDPRMEDDPGTPPDADPDIGQLLETLPADGTPEAILDAAEKIFAEGIHRDLDLEPLAGAILRRAVPSPAEGGASGEKAALAAALRLSLRTARLHQALEAERAQTFDSKTIQLRELALRAPGEAEVIETLRDTLGRLGFHRARLYLKNHVPGGPESREGRLYAWDFVTGTFHEGAATPSDFEQAARELAARHALTFSIPLITLDRVIGNLACDGDCRFGDELAVLTRHATGVVHRLRLHADLARSNETLRETQRELIDVSHRAGVAEVATGVLHNIGNALNSLNISAGVVGQKLGALRIDAVSRIAGLLVNEREAWHRHFTEEERGRLAVAFVQSLEEQLRKSRDEIRGEVQALREGVDHVNEIVAAQQQFAQISGIVEDMEPSEPLEYALRLCEAELLRHQVGVTRDYAPAPVVRMERHKAVQVFVNLIRNAKEALTRSGRADKCIRVGVRATPAGQAQCFVADNGTGIPPELLPRVFTMGFTTKPGGHGFGLHNSALIASSLGGSLRVESEGTGRGATFLLTLPAAPAAGGR